MPSAGSQGKTFRMSEVHLYRKGHVLLNEPYLLLAPRVHICLKSSRPFYQHVPPRRVTNTKGRIR